MPDGSGGWRRGRPAAVIVGASTAAVKVLSPYTPAMAESATQGFIEKFASRLRYPQLFFAVAVLFLVDLVIPDAIPFVDEVMLGLLTVLLARMRKPAEPEAPPPMKDVTPPGGR
jgi:hypothetical protein